MDPSHPAQLATEAAQQQPPQPPQQVSRPLNSQEKDLLAQLDRLKFFLATAPSRWASSNTPQQPQSQSQHPALNRFLLPSGEYVSCVLWNGLYHITGTDIVRALVFRFEAFGRPVVNMKKFEEGVFSDLRNLKPGTDASLEEPKSAFLDLLFKYQCIRTQKKQKVFYWFSVPHDRLFLDALERDLKREKMGHEPTTLPRGEPALSFTFDPKQSLYDQFLNQNLKRLHDEDLDNFDHRAPIGPASSIVATASNAGINNSVVSPADILRRRAEQTYANGTDGTVKSDPAEEESVQKSTLNNSPFFSMFSLFEGSPTYKQRRKKSTKARRPPKTATSSTYEHPPTPPYHAEAGYPSALVTADAHNQSQQLQDAQGQQASSIALMPAHPSLMQAPALQSYGLSSNFTADECEGGAYHPRLSHSPSSVSPPIGLHANLNLAVNASNPGVVGVTSQKKAYLCPLYSCRLAFRRPDCLKRHIRAHRLEKPYACDRCEKRFSRPDLLRQHALVHTHPEGMTATLVDPTEEDGMEFDVGQALVLHDIPATQAYEDDNESTAVYPRPPRSAGAGSDGSGHYFASHTPPFATHPIMHSTSTETSPYVETPQGSGWTQVRGRPTIGIPGGPNPHLHLDVYSAAEAFGPNASTPLSINVHTTSAYIQGGHIHPASAPAQKLAFDHSALYPPPPPTATQSYGVGPRHRSATPSMGRASLDGAGVQTGSRPQTAVSNTSGSINMGAASYNGQFAYTIDEAGAALAHSSSRGSPHSGVYGVSNPGPQEQQQFVPSPHGSFHSGHSNSPPHSLITGHSNGTIGYMAGTFTTGLESYSVPQFTTLHPYVSDNTAVVPTALHDSPEELHLAAAAQAITPGYLQGGLGPASFHGSDDGSPKVYQYHPRSSGEYEGFAGYSTQMSGGQVTSHGQQITGYHYEPQQQVAL